MNRTLSVAAVLAAVVASVTGCDGAEQARDDGRRSPTLTTTPATATSRDPASPAPEEPGMDSGRTQRATVVTDAGRIEAVVVDGQLEMDVESASGWEFDVSREADMALVTWTSGHRSVRVELRSTASGISQHVVSTS